MGAAGSAARLLRRAGPVAAAVAALAAAGCGGTSSNESGEIVASAQTPVYGTFQGGGVVGGTTANVEAFMRSVAKDIDSFWRAAFTSAKRAYPSPKLNILRPKQSIVVGCLGGEKFTGTTANAFWCASNFPGRPNANPAVYLNTGWLGNTVYKRYGDFAVAYTIAHEWGHHVEWLVNLFQLKQQGKILQLHLETMADCLAGIWARSAYSRGLLTEGDIEEVIALADLFGDTPGTTRNDPGAHGRAGIRTAWFMNGYEGDGTVADCKTF